MFLLRSTQHASPPHLQQRPVTSEPCAKGRHPPPAVGRLMGQGPLQDMVNKRAAHVAQLLQNGRAPTQIGLTEAESFLQRQEHFAPARVPNPRADLLLRQSGVFYNISKN